MCFGLKPVQEWVGEWGSQFCWRPGLRCPDGTQSITEVHGEVCSPLGESVARCVELGASVSNLLFKVQLALTGA